MGAQQTKNGKNQVFQLCEKFVYINNQNKMIFIM